MTIAIPLGSQRWKASERVTTASIIALLVCTSMALMLATAPPELSWDEADYALGIRTPWREMWSGDNFVRHNHGPTQLYLTKLGNQVLPGWISLETRVRLPLALVGSLAIALIYLGVRFAFGGSRTAGLVASGLLMFSVIRLEETNIFGPHTALLLCVLSLFVVGYLWRDGATPGRALGLGLILGVTASVTPFAVPVAVYWTLAMIATRGAWIRYDRQCLKFSWLFFAVIATAAVVLLLLWPPAVLRQIELWDLKYLLHWAKLGDPTLVGDRFFEKTPRTAALYWLAHLDLPLLVSGVLTVLGALVLLFQRRVPVSQALYFAIFLGFLFAGTVITSIAGARYLGQFIGILCLAVGVVFDRIMPARPWLRGFAAAAIVVFSIANLVSHWSDPSRVPVLAYDGYRAFVRDNRTRLAEPVIAFADGPPQVEFYTSVAGAPMGWKLLQSPWTTREDASIPADAKYALISEISYRYLPVIRQMTDNNWKVVWSYKTPRNWGLRLYERSIPVSRPETADATKTH